MSDQQQGDKLANQEALQTRLEDGICKWDFESVRQALDDGADPLSFPSKILAEQMPLGFGHHILGEDFSDMKPGDVSILGLMTALSYGYGQISLETALKGRKLGCIPTVTRGAVQLDFLDLLTRPTLLHSWTKDSDRKMIASNIWSSIFDGLDMDLPENRARLSSVAIPAINFVESEVRFRHSEDAQSSLGFGIFANIVLQGIDVDLKKAPSVLPSFGSETPLLGCALYSDDARPYRSQREDLIKRLIELGAPVDARSKDKLQTPMMLAALRVDPSVIGILINAGADPSLKDKRGWTARSYLRSELTKNSDANPDSSIFANGRDCMACLDASLAASKVEEVIRLSQVAEPARRGRMQATAS